MVKYQSRAMPAAAIFSLLVASGLGKTGKEYGPTITYLEGNIRAQNAGSEGWIKADTGTVLGEGVVIAAGEVSRADLEFLDGQIIRIGPRTSLSFAGKAELDSLGTAHSFNPGPGDIWVYLRSMPAERSVSCVARLKKGMVLVYPLLDSLPAVFRMTVGSDSSAEIKVYRGFIYVIFDSISSAADSNNARTYPEYNVEKMYGNLRLAAKTMVIQSFQKLIVSSAGDIAYRGAFGADDPDELAAWVQWNRIRDESTSQQESRKPDN